MFITTNFFLTYSTIWSLTYFFLYFYNFLVFSAIIYLIANIKDFVSYSSFSNSTFFSFLSGFDLFWPLLTPLILILLVNFSWTSPLVSVWFGHLVFSSFQLKMSNFLIIIFTFVWIAYVSSFYFSSQEIYDYTIVTYSFFLWTIFLFLSNNIFTVIFKIISWINCCR